MALSERVLAGGNWWRCFKVTDSTSPTLDTIALLNLKDDILTTTIDKDEGSGAYSVTVEHVEDTQTLYTYLENNMSVSTAGGIEELLLEDGVKEPATTSSNQTQIGITRGGLTGATVGNARKVGVFAVRLRNTSGGWSQAGETYNRVTLEYDGFKLSGAVTVPATFFDSIGTTPAAVGLTTSFPYGRVTFM